MSRHRDVRNLDATDYHDDDSYGSSYGSSYVEETSLSTSMENYIYRRNSGSGTTGHTPKMGHFVLGRSDSVPSVPEEDPDDLELPDRIRESNPLDDLDSRDQEKLAQCLEDVLDIVGDTMPEQLVKEAIVRCDFNSEVAVNTLLNNPVKSKFSPRQQPDAASAETPAASAVSISVLPPPISSGKISSAPVAIAGFNRDIPTIRTTNNDVSVVPRRSARPKIVEVGESRSRSSSPVESSATVSAAASNLTSPCDSEPASGRETPVKNNDVATTVPVAIPSSSSKTPSMRKAKLDALCEYSKRRGDAKPLINLVVVGHVDSGKSTLMGHMLCLLGKVSSRAMHKNETDSKKLGKQSFAFAFVLDETGEERERGVTMDVGRGSFETNSKTVTLLDAPGHKDFIPNMISGAYSADVAILVVNAARGEFEAGFDSGGQTREHALLVRSLGVSQLVVAVNKLDMVDFSRERFDEIVAKLGHFLRQVGFREADTTFVPVSGFAGDNLTSPCERLSSWYSGPTLLAAIDALRPPPRAVDRPFRMSVTDVYRPQQSSSSSGLCCAGRIECGLVLKDDKVLVAPLNEAAVVRCVENGNSDIGGGGDGNAAFAGDHVTLVLSGLDQAASVSAVGTVLCDPAHPVGVARRFRARIVVFAVDRPLTKGMPLVLHHGGVTASATVKKLLAVVDKSSGEVIKRRPRCLAKNCNAVVELSLEQPICMELYAEVKELGRFMLRSVGKTVAAGLVTDILE